MKGKSPQADGMKKKLKREDFMFENGWFQSKVKLPKQLHMQQFQISDCEQCNIFLFDSSACVYVDSCKYCNIFIGPSESSIFVRDCQYVNVVAICQQFRVRDSIGCKFAIFCESQPIIESSYNLTFSCYPQDLTYYQLTNQMSQANLNPWNNNWFDIYDFTPGKFGSHKNYTISSYEKQFIKIKDLCLQKMEEYKIQQSSNVVIPAIEGKINPQTQYEYTLDDVVFLAIHPQILPHSVQSLILQSKCVLLNPQIHKVLPLVQIKDKVLFLKIQKKNQTRWKLCDRILKIITQQHEKQVIQSIVFAPFKDEH